MREYEISIIRLISTASIVICHIQQHYNISLCWWFNVGVQIFFFMSGFLLGGGTEKNSKWLFKRIRRIFTDYFIYIVIIICLYSLFTPETFTFDIIANLLCGKSTIYGAEQLWFVRPLFLCYLHVFLIDYFVGKIVQSNYLIKIIGSAIILFILFFFSIEVDGHWLICFICGYLIRKLFDTRVCHIIIAIITGMFTIGFSYLRIVDQGNNSYYVWWHVFAGVFFFMFLYVVLKKKKLKLSENKKKFLNFTDKYTYDIYINHWLFISSYFSVLELTKYRVANFMMFLILTLLSAYFLFCISEFVNKKLEFYF